MNTKKISKRLLPLALALCLAFTPCAACAAEENPQQPPESEPAWSGMEDVESHWGREAIGYCLENGWMKGASDTLFLPDGTVTRAQVVQVLYNLAGSPDVSGIECPFQDISGHWGHDAILWAWENDIVRGIGGAAFAPDTVIIREQLAQMFKSYRQYVQGEPLAPNMAYLDRFSDRGLVSSWAEEGVGWAVEYGLMSGVGGDRFAPKNTCLRAELAQVVKNYFLPITPTEPGATPGPVPSIPGPVGGWNSSLVSYIRLSPNHSGPRNHKIDTVTIHCMAEDWTVEQCGARFSDPDYQASSNYGVGSDGRIALYVDERNRSWCTSNAQNDNRAVTIEVANIGGGPLWPVSSQAYAALIDLLVDICWRNDIEQLLWQADPSLMGQTDRQNMTVHRWLDDKSCPGDFLYDHHGDIAAKVNQRLVAMRIGQGADGLSLALPSRGRLGGRW